MNKDKLELSPDEMRALGYRVVDLLIERFAHLSEERVGTKADPAVLRPALLAPPHAALSARGARAPAAPAPAVCCPPPPPPPPPPAQPVAANEIFATLQRDVFP